MSQIPNLNTLRTNRSRREVASKPGGLQRKTKDQVIRDTDQDAATARVSAVEAGYLNDPFAQNLTSATVQRRLPLMNRGTFVRTLAIDRIVDTFLSSSTGASQIISLGAGSDTRFFRLRQEHKHENFIYHEIDFPENTRMKIKLLGDPACRAIVKNRCQFEVPETAIDADELLTPSYSIHALDLRKLPSTLPWIRSDLPALVISECCLIYLAPDEADNVLSFFSRLFTDVMFALVIYEPIRPADAFGRTMVSNLVQRGIYLQTLEKYSTLAQQQRRLSDLNLEGNSLDIDTIWQRWVPSAEKERVDHLEWMDEVEEFVLLAQHYCVSWGWRNLTDDRRWQALSLP